MMEQAERLSQQKLSKLTIIIAIIFFLSFIFIAIIELITALQTIRNNAIVQVIARTVFAATTAYLSFQKLSTTSLFVKIITVVTTLIIILQVIIPQKIGIILLTINLLILGIVSICAYLKKQEYTFLIYAEVVLCFIRMCKLSLSFSFEGSGLVFLIIAIVAASIVLVCLGVYFYLKRNRNNEHKLLTVLFISILFTFMFVWTAGINTNYALDFEEPTEISAIIVGKEILDFKRSNEYSLLFDYSGEVREVKVSKTVYELIEIEDNISVKRYNGAYGKAFYVLADQ